jgi:hypothetical protein
MKKKNFIPVNERDRDLILKIQKSVCNSDFMDKFRYNLIAETFDIYTVVLAFMDGIHSIFGRANVDEINIGDEIILIKTVRDKVKNEKSGNINCKMEFGEVAKNLMTLGIDGYKDTLNDDSDMRADMLDAAKLACKYLQDYAIGGLTPEDVYHIAIAFFTYMILTIDECSKNENITDTDFHLEIGSHLAYFEIGFVRKKTKSIMVLNVGPALKLTVKSDAQTE